METLLALAKGALFVLCLALLWAALLGGGWVLWQALWPF
jgi:hypothetical protein